MLQSIKEPTSRLASYLKLSSSLRQALQDSSQHIEFVCSPTPILEDTVDAKCPFQLQDRVQLFRLLLEEKNALIAGTRDTKDFQVIPPDLYRLPVGS